MKKFLAAIGFIALLVVVAGADAMFNDAEIMANVSDTTPSLPPMGSQKTSVGTPVVAVPIASGPDVVQVLTSAGFTTTETSNEKNLLSQVGNTTVTVKTRILLSGNDRIGSISWVAADGNVKPIFQALRQALLTSFSAEVQGLRDEKEEKSGFKARTILTFLDPKLSAERFLFLQSGENLYEMHIVPMQEEKFYGLVDALTKR